MPENRYITTVREWGLGWILALIILVVCILLYFVSRPLSSNELLLFIGALALTRLL